MKSILLIITIFITIFFAESVFFTTDVSAAYCGGTNKCDFCNNDLGKYTCGGGVNLNAGCSPNSPACGPLPCKCGNIYCNIGDTCEWHPDPPQPPPPPGNPPPQPPPSTPVPPGNPTPEPPPPNTPERCYHCVGYQCRGYDVDPGTCDTDCGDNNCASEEPIMVNCPKCENYQCINEDVPIGTCTTVCNPLTCVPPPFNYVKTCQVSRSSPSITTTQQITINASGTSNAPATEVEPVRLVIAKSDYSKWTDPPSGTLEAFVADKNRYFYIYQTDPVLPNGSFENGKNYWSASSAIRTPWSIVSNLLWPVPTPPPVVATHGSYYLSAGREWVDDSVSADAHIVSDWIETSGDVTGESFKLIFKAKGHANVKTIKGIVVQRYPKVSGSTLDWSNTMAGFGDITIDPSGWTEFNRNVVFPYPSNGNNSSKIRIVLRVSSFGDGYEAVYYDHFRLSRNTANTFNCKTSSNITCSDGVTIKGEDMTDGEIAPGDYVAFCDMPTNPPPPDNRLFMCSGNPNCIFNGGNVGTDSNCSTWWKDCKDDVNNPNDHTTFSVIQNCSAPYCGRNQLMA